MKRYKIGLLGVLLILAVSTATIVYAAGSSDVLKKIYREDAPLVPEAPGKNEDGSAVEADLAAWKECFKYIREHDPDYYADTVGYEDTAKGDYEFMLAEWESLEAMSYSGINKRADKIIDLFSNSAEKYVNEYNARVKDGTTYVTEDMKAVSLGFFIPFTSFKKAYVSTFDTNQDAATMTASLKSMLELFGGEADCKVEIVGENHFVASYESEYTDDDWNSHPGSVVIDCYYYPDRNGVAMYAKTYDKESGELAEFEMFEHMQLDENTFVFQNAFERLITVGSEEEVQYFSYSGLKNSEEKYSEEDSIFGYSGAFDMTWVNDRDISAYSLVLTRDELDYMKASNGGKFYTIFIER